MGVDNSTKFCGGDDCGCETELVLKPDGHDDVGKVRVGFV